MSIVCINLNDSPIYEQNKPRVNDFVKTAEADALQYPAYVIDAAMMNLTAQEALGECKLPEDMVRTIKMASEEPEQVELGRTGLRKLTSAWAQEKHPTATHELVVTLSEANGQRVHTLLILL